MILMYRLPGIKQHRNRDVCGPKARSVGSLSRTMVRGTDLGTIF